MAASIDEKKERVRRLAIQSRHRIHALNDLLTRIGTCALVSKDEVQMIGDGLLCGLAALDYHHSTADRFAKDGAKRLWRESASRFLRHALDANFDIGPAPTNDVTGHHCDVCR